MGKVADDFLASHRELLEADETSAGVIHLVSTLLAPLEAYHRFECHGMENVPQTGCLIIANHSAGTLQEVLLLMRAWHRRFGDRPVRALSHQIFWQFPGTLLHFPKLGAILAHPEVARRKLEEGCAILLFPGGDLEAMRPFSERYRVTLGGRKGFISIARKARVPIVPLVICGSHANYIMLPGTDVVAQKTPLGKLFGTKRVPVTLGSVALTASVLASLVVPPLLPVAISGIIPAALPLPSRIEAEVLPPIQPGEDESDDAFFARLLTIMQSTMDRLAAKRLTPWF